MFNKYYKSRENAKDFYFRPIVVKKNNSKETREKIIKYFVISYNSDFHEIYCKNTKFEITITLISNNQDLIISVLAYTNHFIGGAKKEVKN